MKDTLLAHTGGKHNKFWCANVDPHTHDVTVRYGRIGTKGVEKKSHYPTAYQAESFIYKKKREKERKGYMTISEHELEKMHVRAAIVGTQNHCNGMKWVELKDTGSKWLFTPVNEDKLLDPSCTPGLLVDFDTRKEIAGRTKFAFLLAPDGTYDVGLSPRNNSRFDGETLKGNRVDDKNPLWDIVKNIEEAVGTTLF